MTNNSTPEAKPLEFIGVYRKSDRPNQRIPVHSNGVKNFDLLGNEIDISKMIKID